MRFCGAPRPASALLLLSLCTSTVVPLRADTVAQPPRVSLAAATTPEAIEQRLQGKTLFLRGFYADDHLEFDTAGKVQGNPTKGSFTLSGLQVKKVHFTKHSVEIEADRIALHFFGALPYEDDSKPYESMKVAGKPVQISIERLVIEPEKKKKNKDKKKDEARNEEAKKEAIRKGASVPASAAPVAEDDEDEGVTPKVADTVVAQAGTPTPKPADAPVHRDPKESYVVLSQALDKIFANAIDQSVIDTLPGAWQAYFATKAGKARTATDAAALHAGGDVKAPHLVAMISPDSNDYAQKSGIAGMVLLQTVVDPSGKPGQVTIVRPIGFGLDEKAVEAVEKSQFRPGTQGGKAVPVLVNLEVTFRIYSDRTRPHPGSPDPALLQAGSSPTHDGSGTVAAATVKR